MKYLFYIFNCIFKILIQIIKKIIVSQYRKQIQESQLKNACSREIFEETGWTIPSKKSLKYIGSDRYTNVFLLDLTNQEYSDILTLIDLKNVNMYREVSNIRFVKETDIKGLFVHGATDVELDENNLLTFKRPYAGDIQAKFIAIGDYDVVKDIVPGRLSLDEASQSQMFFLAKYLGNYEFNKIGNKFLIRNGSKAIVIEKDRW